MSQKKNKLQRLEEIKNSYQVDPAVAKRAIEQIEREEQAKANKKHSPFLKFIPVIATAICAVFISVAVYFATLPPEVVYFDDKQVEVVNDINVEELFTEKGVRVNYLKESTARNKAGVIIDSGKLGYLWQEVQFSNFDIVQFYAVALENADFDFEKFYQTCALEYTYTNSIKVNYESSFEKDTFGYDKLIVKAKFTYEGHDYFITIETYAYGEVSATGKIAEYLDLLLAE